MVAPRSRFSGERFPCLRLALVLLLLMVADQHLRYRLIPFDRREYDPGNLARGVDRVSQ